MELTPGATTLIVLSQAWRVPAEIEAERVYHASIRGNELDVVGQSSDSAVSRPLPAKTFSLPDITGPDLSDWKAVITWLQYDFGKNSIILVDHTHPLRELVLFANSWSGLRYGLRYADRVPSLTALEYALVANSELVLLESPEARAEFERNFICPHTSADSLSEVLSLIDGFSPTPLRLSPEPRSGSGASGRESEPGRAPIRVLLVSYFSGDCRSVAVQRINYWMEQIGEVSNGQVEIHLATALGGQAHHQNVHVVPDRHAAGLLGKSNQLPPWASKFIESEVRNAKAFSTLSHYWRYSLEQYFDGIDEGFDVVIISGNPFACFDFAAYAKRRWHARVILDYRDPFANNPRFQYTPEAREWARYIERGYNLQSDAVAVVSDHVAGFLEARADLDVVVVPNGYDERISGHIERAELLTDVVNFVHAGSFYHYGSPRTLLGEMDPSNHLFHHVGSDSGLESDLRNHAAVVMHGRKDYETALSIVGGADCGVVFLSESSFETTTKVFDYLAMGIDILLCTPGEVGQGALAEILGDQEGVYWCKNTSDDVAGFLESYRPSRSRDSRDTERFTRRHSTELLIDKILDLTTGAREAVSAQGDRTT